MVQLSRYFITASLLLFCFSASAQVPTSISPVPKLQFLSNAGIPLASGCLFSYQSGTSTPQATYIDSLGISQNTNPVILDAGGRADVWLSNQSYKLVLKTAGGVNCASGSQIFSEDNISGFLGLLSLSNIWTNAQTFSQPITIMPTINQIVAGTSPNQTTLNFPAPAGNVSLTFPTTADTMVGRATTDTLTNKTLTSPVLNTPNLNGTVIPGLPATYFTMANDLVTGTTLNKLTKINPAGLAGFAILPLITDTGGIVGITVSGAGITGNATIQQNGSVSCIFDNATTSGNYIQISPTIAGDCHDAGVSYPSTGQIIGRSLATNAAIGTNIIDLFSPELKPQNIYPQVVYNTLPTPGNTNLGTITMATAPASGAMYRFSVTASVTVIGTGCTGTSTVQVFGVWTDPNEAGANTQSFFTLLPLGGNNGTVGRMILSTGPGSVPLPYGGLIRAKGGSVVAFNTNYIAGATCAPAPIVQIYPILEQLTAN